MIYPHHFESSVSVAAAPGELFAELDDHARLVAHMTRSSAMMAGSSMQFSFDETRGQAVGSKILMKDGSWLTVFIDYQDSPAPWRWLGRLLGPAYARWCTQSMAKGAADVFSSRAGCVRTASPSVAA